MRIRGPVRTWRNGKSAGDWIYADAILPDQYRDEASPGAWNPDGTYPVEVVLAHNRNSLAAFLASGDLEWDVRNKA
ncbi:hypothetical protein [Burkholderia sp. PU8-34]